MHELHPISLGLTTSLLPFPHAPTTKDPGQKVSGIQWLGMMKTRDSHWSPRSGMQRGSVVLGTLNLTVS